MVDGQLHTQGHRRNAVSPYTHLQEPCFTIFFPYILCNFFFKFFFFQLICKCQISLQTLQELGQTIRAVCPVNRTTYIQIGNCMGRLYLYVGSLVVVQMLYTVINT